MWLKLIFATFYLVTVIILSRLVDVVINAYDLQPLSIFPTYLVVDPMVLSVTQLKQALSNRGISYAGLWEKQELREAIISSGEVAHEELRSLETEEPELGAIKSYEKQVTRFTCGAHFYELVDDTKDCAWLILVKPGGRFWTEPDNWRKLVSKVSRFGIRTGIFDCSLDKGLCDKKKWNSARVLLVMPKDNFKARDEIAFHQYVVNDTVEPMKIFKWMNELMATRVKRIDGQDELNKWLAINQSSSGIRESTKELKFVLVSALATPPLILSALAMKFNGRIKFGMVCDSSTGDTFNKLQQTTVIHKLPLYLVSLADHSVYHYGNKAGEVFSYRSMELFLRTVKPEMNDIFLVNLLIVNIVIGLHFFWIKCSSIWMHGAYWFANLIKTNCLLFLLWLSILTVSGLPSARSTIELGLSLCQYIATSSGAAFIRHDSLQYYKTPILTTAFIFCGICVATFRRKMSDSESNDDEFLFRDWAPWESTILSYILFRPMGMSLRPLSTSIETNLEEGMELLIERLAVPNLWLQPELISNEYIKDLPVWHFRPSINTSETESEVDSHSDSMDEFTDIQADISSSDSDATVSGQLLNASCDQAESRSASRREGKIDSDNKSLTPQLKKRNGRDSARSLTRRHDAKFTTVSASATNCTARNNEQSRRDASPLTDQPPEGMLVCKECAICLEQYRKDQLVCGLPCGHNYHEACIMSWLFRDNHCCPKCRWPTYKKNKLKFT
ncbi:E3 ubiquitin-protein ligase [Halotydeus destructor]|nr:E3 ubiquitin-protein ligase [Halotydeus destructor]